VFHTILIVDDSPLIRHLVRSYIDRYPEWQVCGEAANGREGIDKAQELHPDLIVLDLSMPVMNGIEAAAVLKRLMPTVPVIIFSEYSSVLSDAEARSAGISALVSKTENISALLGKATALLP
jgi:DNA-binding NarL/FixJ family response regulator